jgi:hypothetical protein
MGERAPTNVRAGEDKQSQSLQRQVRGWFTLKEKPRLGTGERVPGELSRARLRALYIRERDGIQSPVPIKHERKTVELHQVWMDKVAREIAGNDPPLTVVLNWQAGLKK